MYRGYVEYGGVELVNAARLAAYVAARLVPDGTRVDPNVGDYTDLPAALGHEPYRTPLLDAAPWYDPTNPDSANFAGLVPLELTGLDGSTKVRQISERIVDGGIAGPVRATSKAIGATVMALGSGEAALDAGLTWLTGILHPPCAGAQEACGGAPLELFAAAPTYCDRLPNPDADPTTAGLIAAPLDADGPSLAYFDVNGELLEGLCGEVTVEAVVAIEASEVPAIGRTVTLDLIDTTGLVAASSGPVDLPSDGDPVTLTVTTDPTPGFPADWQPVLSWSGTGAGAGGFISGGDATTTGPVLTGGDADGPWEDTYSAGDADGPWSTGDGFGGRLHVETWTYTRQPALTVEECLGDLRRSLRNVVTIDGPHVTEVLADHDGQPYAARVEWTWVATDPTIYGDTDQLLSQMMVGRLLTDAGTGAIVYAEAATTGQTNLVAPAPPRWPAVYSIGGVTINTYGQRALFKDQTHQAENGVRYFQGFGLPWLRVAEMDTWAETVGAIVQVSGATTDPPALYLSDTTGGGTLETDPITFTAAAYVPGTDYDDTVLFSAEGIQIAANADITAAATDCPLPVPSLLQCGDDPDLPVLLAPPAPPTVPDPAMVTVTDYVRREFQLPPEWSPAPGAVLTLSMTNLGAEDYRGIRVRMWADPDPDFGVADECAFELEVYVTFLEAGQTLVIDGPNRNATVTCSTGLDSDHERNLRGAYGGPFVFPEVRCGFRYHFAIDTPADDPQGGISVDLAATRRVV